MKYELERNYFAFIHIDKQKNSIQQAKILDKKTISEEKFETKSDSEVHLFKLVNKRGDEISDPKIRAFFYELRAK